MVHLQTAHLNQLPIRTTGLAANKSSSSQTLTDQVSQAFSQTLLQLGIDPASFKLTIQPVSVQTSPVLAQTATTATATAATATNTSKIGFNALIGSASTPTAPAEGSTKPVEHWYGANAVDDAWWGKQPEPVQQLREIDDTAQRQQLATQLAGQGYQIDVPIMVWGWDAGITTALRQSGGYSWVPSALQPNVTAAPGVSGPGMTPYDPANPPAGSILVG